MTVRIELSGKIDLCRPMPIKILTLNASLMTVEMTIGGCVSTDAKITGDYDEITALMHVDNLVLQRDGTVGRVDPFPSKK